MPLNPSPGAVREPDWTKSSHSTDDGPACVEVAACPDTVLVRDSKHPDGPRLAFTPATWAGFLPYAAQRQ